MKQRPWMTALLLAGSAQAHVTLEQREAEAGTPYKAVLRVGHGCDGSATRKLTVLLPEGFKGAKPMPKAGWTLSLRMARLKEPYESHGKSVTEGLAEVSWTANTEADWLQDAWYDEFVVRGTLPGQPGPLWFKVRQDCVQGAWDWSELPAEGMSTSGLKAPAVLLRVTPRVPR
ncbi:YcnI family protein [Pelomonas sp. SE-A7]|uniref:YcnI family copper-binding membrane protein n=1 Tax=Pelomonas sp. SE-A7 TaxID=3054953 RepID=UPI00259CF9D0|nr:YcnI family protein [Pelomonas sp. SE-A7]MDM4766212.1 YcnI family protein [Pelomonas sp. SE-A7]